jgi:hypothetical protein
VQSSGCTNSDVVFTSTSSGNWDFGVGAVPQTATATSGPVTVSYATLGLRSITFNGTVLNAFVNIFNDGPTLPSITPASPTLDLGCPYTFTTSLQGVQYDWNFGATANPANASGPLVTTTPNIIFDTPGSYWVRVTVQTACCGPVTDSTLVTVQLNAFDIALSPAALSLCEGESVTLAALPNTYASYEFFLDGVSVQAGPGNTLTSSTLQTGDSIWVEAFAGSCFTNPSDTVVATVTPLPIATLVSDDADNTNWRIALWARLPYPCLPQRVCVLWLL